MEKTREYNEVPKGRWLPLILGSLLFLFLGMIFGGLSRAGMSLAWLGTAHHISVGIGGATLITCTILAYRQLIESHPASRLMTISSFLFSLEILLGQLILKGEGRSFLVGIHFAISVIILGSVSATAMLVYNNGNTKENKRLNFSKKSTRQSVILVCIVMIILISGAWLAGSGNGNACVGWPLCNGSFIPDKASIAPYMHRLLVLIVGVYLLRFVNDAWKEHRTEKTILPLANSLLILFIAQGYMGALISLREFPVGLVVLHEITAALIIINGSLLLISLGLHSGPEKKEFGAVNPGVYRKQRFNDFLQLNKPVVVSLLLATTLAGMIMGYKGFPPIEIVLVTLVSGALAAGGSGAVNQYIDRDIDEKMTRTARRPIPSGRLTPAEGLAFGVSSMLISFYLMAGLVNMLAALLTLAGMIYYVYFYSILLKRKSVQNIVIGGGAGAIPPMVGWAAASGNLNLEAFFLFLIIFLWTPPHFWALALTRKNEYAAAQVPMMPVERGEDITRKLILQYTVVLVFSTILMWFLDLAGWVFLFGAVVLGAYLILLAWQVWKNGRNRIYYRMYKHSNYYLLLLFAILAIDSVLI